MSHGQTRVSRYHGRLHGSALYRHRRGPRCRGGELLGKIHLPETCANLVFGGLLRNRLYMCASTSVYACYVNTQGAAAP